VLKIIKEALTEAYKEKATKFVLYYVGHGHAAQGGWVCYLPGDQAKAIVEEKE